MRSENSDDWVGGTGGSECAEVRVASETLFLTSSAGANGGRERERVERQRERDRVENERDRERERQSRE